LREDRYPKAWRAINTTRTNNEMAAQEILASKR